MNLTECVDRLVDAINIADLANISTLLDPYHHHVWLTIRVASCQFGSCISKLNARYPGVGR
eukprot:scaffold618782_cov18-Prasinocladus_malaysianus.AAC.1